VTVQEPVSLRTQPYPGDVYRTYSDAPAVLRPRRGPGLHIALFVATFISTATASAFNQGVNVFAEPSRLLIGFPYAIAIMTILLCHECGHYFLARAHRVDATLPFFIPAPPVVFFIGTLGAFIRMRSLPRDRRALFDIGAAGPWAGIFVAIPVLLIGLSLSEVQPGGPGGAPGLFLGDSLLFKALTWLVLGTTGDDVTILLHPVALAGWVGLLVTALNLLPVGQLDGGHVVYAAFGEHWHRWISRGTLVALIVLGLGGAATWLVWAVLLSFLGLGHPRLVDSERPLDRRRTWAAGATLVLFLLTFMPQPVYFNEPPPRIPRDEQAIPISAPASARGAWAIST
jgi:membrane-associated protease RseP (regulator of RpoE activity)